MLLRFAKTGCHMLTSPSSDRLMIAEPTVWVGKLCWIDEEEEEGAEGTEELFFDVVLAVLLSLTFFVLLLLLILLLLVALSLMADELEVEVEIEVALFSDTHHRG